MIMGKDPLAPEPLTRSQWLAGLLFLAAVAIAVLIGAAFLGTDLSPSQDPEETAFLKSFSAQKDLERQKEMATQFAQRRPQSAGGHFARGWLANVSGDFVTAEHEYSDAIRLEPNFAQAHNGLGNAYLNQERYDEARSEYRIALALDPGLAEAHVNLAIIHYQEGEIDQAIAENRAALALSPGIPEAHFNLGLAYQQAHELQKAADEYKKAIAASPELAQAYYNLAIILDEMGKTQDAQRFYTEFVKRGADFPEQREEAKHRIEEFSRHEGRTRA